MPPKAPDTHPLQWLYDRGEEALGQLLTELLGRKAVGDGLSRVVRQAARTKGRVDKNMETMLHLLNLPSHADYHKLLVKIEHLQGSLINLNMKLDRLLAAQERPQRKPRRRAGDLPQPES